MHKARLTIDAAAALDLAAQIVNHKAYKFRLQHGVLVQYLQGLRHRHIRPGEGRQHLANVALLRRGFAGEQQFGLIRLAIAHVFVAVLVQALCQDVGQAPALSAIRQIVMEL